MEWISVLISAGLGAVAALLLMRWHARRTVRVLIAQFEADKRRRRSDAVARGNRTRAAKRAAVIRAKAEELNRQDVVSTPTAAQFPGMIGQGPAQA